MSIRIIYAAFTWLGAGHPVRLQRTKSETVISIAQLNNVAGLLLNSVGVLLLFRFGMPYRIGLDLEIVTEVRGLSGDEQRLNQRYRRVGTIGLFFVLAGTVFQVIGTVLG